MSETRKKISIPSNDYKHTYGLSYGSIGTPYYETLSNIKALLVDGVKVSEHIGDDVVELTIENFDKDNTGSEEEEVPVVTVSTVNLSLNSSTLMEGETTSTVVTVLPQEAEDKTVVYTSESNSIAIVAQDGTVTAVKGGQTNIVATSVNGKVGKAQITVNARPVEVASVTLTVTNANLTEGETATVSSDVQPSEAINKEVTYTIENDSIATIGQDGTVTAVAEGTVNIIGRTSNGTEGTVSITVSPTVPV